MELTLVIRSQEEMASTIEAIVRGVADGLRAARDKETDNPTHVQLPDDLVITGVYLVEANVLNIDETQITPATEVTSTDTTPATNVVTTSARGAQSTTETGAPANRTTTRGEAGGDVVTEDTDYEEIT